MGQMEASGKTAMLVSVEINRSASWCGLDTVAGVGWAAAALKAL